MADKSFIELVVSDKDIAAMDVLLKSIPRAANRIIPRAINKIARSSRSKIIKMISKQIMLTQKSIRDHNIAMRLATRTRRWATILVKGPRIPLIKFAKRQTQGRKVRRDERGRFVKRGEKATRGGIKYRIERGKGTEFLPGGFKQTMRSGHTGIFTRYGEKRLPINEKFGPSIPMVMQNIHELASGILEQDIANKLSAEIERLVILELDKAAA